jgi:hypothetical protein
MNMSRNFDDELSRLCAQLSEFEESLVNKGVADFKDLFNRLTTLYLFYRYLAERGIANGAPRSVRMLFAKVANCVIGVIRLLRAGHSGPAAMLLRSLFETAVHLQVVLKADVLERPKLFEEYLFIERSNSTAWKVPNLTI